MSDMRLAERVDSTSRKELMQIASGWLKLAEEALIDVEDGPGVNAGGWTRPSG